MDSEIPGTRPCGGDVTSTKTKILAYLGELRRDEFVSARKLCYDLSLRFTTAKNTLSLLETRGLVEKKIETTKGTVASFRISPDAGMVRRMLPTGAAMSAAVNHTVVVPYIPPEWSDAYGKHPHST